VSVQNTQKIIFVALQLSNNRQTIIDHSMTRPVNKIYNDFICLLHTIAIILSVLDNRRRSTRYKSTKIHLQVHYFGDNHSVVMCRNNNDILDKNEITIKLPRSSEEVCLLLAA